MKKEENIVDVAVVTLFNPEDNFVDNLRTYLPYVKELLIVDNSKKPFDLISLTKDFSSIHVLSHSQNLGIAKALNLAITYAQNKGYKYLLTMDQDSYFPLGEFKMFILSFDEVNHTNLAIFSPLHNKNFLEEKRGYNSEEDYVMTSGNIININSAIKTGLFDEKLFIDEVDHDFCLRLREQGFSILQNHNCYIHHTLGTRYKNINLYSSQRLYYMIRNYLHIRKKHKENWKDFFRKRDRYLLKFFMKQVIYAKNKKESIRMIFQGIQDYRNNLMGYRIKL